MRLLFLEYKNEFRKKYIPIIFIALIAVVIIFNIFVFRAPDYLQRFQISQKTAMIIFAGIFFVSVEIFGELKDEKMAQLLQIKKGGLIKSLFAKHIIVCSFIASCFFVDLIIELIRLNNSGAYSQLHECVFKVVVLNYALCPLTAMFVGKLFARLFKKKWAAYFAMLIVVVLVCGLFYKINVALYETVGVNLDSLYKYFQLEQPNDNWAVDYQYLVPAEKYRVYIYLIWIFISQVLMIFTVKRVKVRALYIVCPICLIALYVAINDIQYYKPSLNYNLNYAQATNKISEFESDSDIREEEANFTVESYDILIACDNTEFMAFATLTLGDEDVEEYKFTLYRGYDDITIWDKDGNNVEFEREGDYITVFTGGKVDTLEIYYGGVSQVFYASNNAVFLPGYFAYYPQPGFRPVFVTLTDEDGNSYSGYNTSNTTLEESHFTVGAFSNSSTDLHSNYQHSQAAIEEGEDYVFEGYGIAPTILLGPIGEKQEDGVNIIYNTVYESLYSFDFSWKDVLDELKKKCAQNDSDFLKENDIDTIIFAPRTAEINGGWCTESVCDNTLYLSTELMSGDEDPSLIADWILENYEMVK